MARLLPLYLKGQVLRWYEKQEEPTWYDLIHEFLKEYSSGNESLSMYPHLEAYMKNLENLPDPHKEPTRYHPTQSLFIEISYLEYLQDKERLRTGQRPPLLKIEKRFDGQGNPDLHMEAFEAHMRTKLVPSYLKLYLFGNSLTGDALTWYETLSVQYKLLWEGFSNIFRTVIFSRVDPERVILEEMSQMIGESFLDYGRRWLSQADKTSLLIPRRHMPSLLVAGLREPYSFELQAKGNGSLPSMMQHGLKLDEYYYRLSHLYLQPDFINPLPRSPITTPESVWPLLTDLMRRGLVIPIPQEEESEAEGDLSLDHCPFHQRIGHRLEQCLSFSRVVEVLQEMNLI